MCDGGRIRHWITYEAIVNRALERHPVWVICGYDTREVAGPLLDGALDPHSGDARRGMGASALTITSPGTWFSRTPAPAPLAGLRPLRLEGGPRGFREILSTGR